MSFGQYYKSLNAQQKRDLADKIGSKVSYLRHVANSRKQLSPALAKAVETASNGECPREQSRPDIFN
jgi:DNA-binding transcriptional regulator YdaS (Cro superfamily)